MNAIIDNIKNQAAQFDILNGLKIDQIAIGTKDGDKLVKTLSSLGLTEWTKDTVLAKGSVRGVENLENTAILHFNYQMGIEFEVLEYVFGESWHDKIRIYENQEYILSHIGYHLVDDMSRDPICQTAEEKLQEIKEKFLAAGYKIAQEVWTQKHTNEYLIQQKRKYHYIIFDTREAIGFDVKLIVRRENA